MMAKGQNSGLLAEYGLALHNMKEDLILLGMQQGSSLLRVRGTQPEGFGGFHAPARLKIMPPAGRLG